MEIDNPPFIVPSVSLKCQAKIAADDTLIFLPLSFKENKLDVSCEA